MSPTTVRSGSRVTTTGLIDLRDVPDLTQEWIGDAHRRHLNPALMTLMRLGGYDDVRIVRAAGPHLFTADGRRLLDLVSAYGALSQATTTRAWSQRHAGSTRVAKRIF